MAQYGCSDADSNSRQSIPSFRVPAWARPSSHFDEGDANMEIIQPNGDTVSLYQCRPQRDWRHGDVVGDSSSICGRFGGASYGNIVTSSGVNPSNVNGGNNFAALPVHYREVMQGQINHALLVWAGCFTGAVYPAKWQALSCKNPPGIPSGAHIWLSLTRQQIDALPASVVPVHMRPFAYAAHEYGIYTMDTGDGKKWFGQPALEDSLPYVLSGGGTESYWAGWFKQHGGGMSGDANLKMSGRGNIIDWSALAPYLYVLDPCYAKGTCRDSVPEGAMSQPEPPPATYKVQVAWEYPAGVDARQVVTEVFHAGSVVATSAAGGLMASFETTATGKYCVTARARQGERTGDHSPEACVDINPPMQALPVLLNLKVILP